MSLFSGKNNGYLWLGFAVLALLMNKANAQDFHFSQFDNAPLLLNPAHAGVFMGEIRGNSIYRKQWSSISGMSADYRTVAASIDGGLLKRKSKKGNFLGIGGVFLSDKAGDSHFGTTSFNLIGSWIKSISPLQDQFLSLAGQVGYVQRGVSAGGLTWDSNWAFDHIDTSIPGEDLLGTFGFFDKSIGAMYFNLRNERRKFHAGVSINHLLKTNVSFIKTDPYKRKLTLHAGGTFANSASNRVLQPAILITKQGRQIELTAGTYFKYVMKSASVRTGLKTETAIAFGVWYRFKDAIIGSVRFDYNNFNLGLGYDFSLSRITKANAFLGGPEISITYTSPAKKTRVAGRYKNVRYL